MISMTELSRNKFEHAFKVCPCCGRSYLFKDQFLAETAFVGTMGYLKLYNCPCGSTMAIKG